MPGADPQIDRFLSAVNDDTFAKRVELVEQIGAGGMGTVFMARHRESGRKLAVKWLTNLTTDDIRRFASEAAVLEGLEHPNIVGFVEHGATTNGDHYLVMDWIEGESLDLRLRRSPLTVAEVAEVAAQVAEALACAHGEGIAHRDLKPGNIMLVDGLTSKVCLIDFGVAKRFDDPELTKLTATGAIVGTPGYLAPEQIEGGALDGRTDLFALGCVMFELLAGQRPFVGETVLKIIMQVVSSAARPLASRCEAPARLCQLVDSMLSRNPDMRPPSAGRVATELRETVIAIRQDDSAWLASASPFAPREPTPGPLATTQAGKRLSPPQSPEAAAAGSKSSTHRQMWPKAAFGTAVVAALVLIVWQLARSDNGTAPGEPNAQNETAVKTISPPGPRCERDDVRGCEVRCADGDQRSCTRLGEALMTGSGAVPRDRDRALTVLKKACEGGQGRACASASTLVKLSAANGDPSWLPEYRRLLELGCSGEFANACRRLASSYLRADYHNHDAARGRAFAIRGCRLGDAFACAILFPEAPETAAAPEP